jgi:predicted nucleic-acid-binding protein
LTTWTKLCATASEQGSVLLSADTNVLVRLLVSDDLVQQRAVAARLEKVESAGGAVFVSLLVLAELSWVLESTYDYGRGDVARSVEAILTTSPFVVDERALVLDALSAFRKGGSGFADHLVLAVARTRGALPLLTFDRKLLRQNGCEKP